MINSKSKYEKFEEKLKLRMRISSLIILIFIPLTIYIGIKYLGDRKYLFISTAILFQTMAPFFMIFEERMPKTREMVLIASLVAIGVTGRLAFFWLPQFKPIIAVTIISAIALGSESGFLVGAMIAFVSNFFFGQGPWTPWQMFATGIIGFIAGFMFRKSKLSKNKYVLSSVGFLLTFIVYGGIMDPASVIMFSRTITKELVIAAYISGVYFNLIYSVATFVFLFFFGEEFLEKINRIKIKYGMIQ